MFTHTHDAGHTIATRRCSALVTLSLSLALALSSWPLASVAYAAGLDEGEESVLEVVSRQDETSETDESVAPRVEDAEGPVQDVATLVFELHHASVRYGRSTIEVERNSISVPGDEDIRFSAQADEGYELDEVLLTTEEGSQVLKADAQGNYLVEASRVRGEVTVSVTATEVPTKAQDSFAYEDKNLRVEAKVTDPDALPEGAQLRVSPVTVQSKKYAYGAYLEALNDEGLRKARDAGLPDEEATLYRDADTLLYDVGFYMPKVDEDGAAVKGKKVEVPLTAGTVKLTFHFKKHQLVETLGAKTAEDIEVVHLPLDKKVRARFDSTADATEISAHDVVVEEPEAKNVTCELEKEKLSFSLKSLSIVALHVAQTEADDEREGEPEATDESAAEPSDLEAPDDEQGADEGAEQDDATEAAEPAAADVATADDEEVAPTSDDTDDEEPQGEEESAPLTIDFDKVYLGSDASEGMFTFVAAPATDEFVPEAGEVGALKTTNAAFGADGIAHCSFEVGDLKDGTYHYVVSEEDVAGCTTDPSEILVTLEAKDGVAKVTYYALREANGDVTDWTDVYTATDDTHDVLTFFNNTNIVAGERTHAFTLDAERYVAYEPTVHKVLENGTLVGDDFEFVLAGENTSVKANNDFEGSVSFGSLLYSEDSIGQTFTYTITETDTGVPDVTYSTQAIVLTVDVTAGEDGLPSVTATYTWAGEDDSQEVYVDDSSLGTEAVEQALSGDVELPTFYNVYEGEEADYGESLVVLVHKYERGDDGKADESKPLAGAHYGLWMVNPEGQDIYMGEGRNQEEEDGSSYGSAEDGSLYYDLPLTTGVAYYFREQGTPPDGHLIDPYPTDYFTLVYDEADGYSLMYEYDISDEKDATKRVQEFLDWVSDQQ